MIVLGIDGLDFDVVRRHRNTLPNISEMMERWGIPRLSSVFPADTTPAWATIYTGRDPSEHGIINFVNIGDRDNRYKPREFDDSVFRGVTFWDRLCEAGFSCAVLMPMNIKVGYPINGIMMTRPIDGEMYIYPEEKRELYKPDPTVLGTEGKFTSEASLAGLKREFFAKVAEEIRLTKAVIENEDVDFMFSYFSTADGIQHDFWRHYDRSHPDYPGENEFEDTIPEMYRTFDRLIGELCEMCPDAKILILSDHGHGARPVYIARINELLRRGGYLFPKKGEKSTSKPGLTKRIKKGVKKICVGFVKRVGLPKWLMKLLKKVPVWKSLFASGNDFDWEKTVAYLSDLSALKNYSYGGIRIRADVEDKDSLADEIMEYLRGVKIDGEDVPLFSWIVRTNTYYHGEYLDRYPEIIYQMDERFGGEWELGEKLFEKAGFMYKFSPGGHRRDTAVIGSRGIPLEGRRYEMDEVYGIIMDAMREE